MANNTDKAAMPGMKQPPTGLGILLVVGPSMIWCAEYIGSGEVILATRVGAILGVGVLWAIVVGIFLKYWIGLSGARYTVCTGEGMIDMFDRIGPWHIFVWIVLVVQFAAATISIGSIANATGVFIHNIVPAVPSQWAGWAVTFFALSVVWSGIFDVLKIVMSLFVFIIVIGVLYVAVHVFPGFGELLRGLSFNVPAVPDWAQAIEGVSRDPWREILPLLGWGAGGFASQVWYTYWVLGAGYGACEGRGYGEKADESMLKRMPGELARKIKGWCRVLYLDATIAMIIGIVVTGSFYIAGAGILGPEKIAPKGEKVAIELANIFSSRWGQVGGFMFMLAGTVALLATQIGQMAGWPRLLADSFRLCIPGIARRFTWKVQFRFFLLIFVATNMVLVFIFKEKPVLLVKIGAIFDGLLLTPLQAILVGVGIFWVMPRMLSAEAARILKPHWIFAVGLIIAFLVFGYFCLVQLPLTIHN